MTATTHQNSHSVYSESRQKLHIHRPIIYEHAYTYDALVIEQPDARVPLADFIAIPQHGNEYYYEAKSDLKPYPNVCLELVSNIYQQIPYLSTHDDRYDACVDRILSHPKRYLISSEINDRYYLSYYSMRVDRVFLARLDLLRDLIIESLKNKKYPLVGCGAPMQSWYSISMLIPIEDFKSHIPKIGYEIFREQT